MKTKLKTMLVVLVALLLSALLLTGCMGEEENVQTPSNNQEESVNSTEEENIPVVNSEITAETEGYTTYTYGDDNIQFSYPDTWVSVGTDDTPLFLDNNGTGTSAGIVKEEIPSSISFDGYIEAAKIQVKSQLTVEGDINQEKINLNGREAYQLSYVAKSDEDNTVSILQTIIKEDNTVYALTVGTLQDNYEDLKETIETISASLRKGE